MIMKSWLVCTAAAAMCRLVVPNGLGMVALHVCTCLCSLVLPWGALTTGLLAASLWQQLLGCALCMGIYLHP